MGKYRTTAYLLLALLLLSCCAMATGFETPGIGTKARGMGGAFRAIANDWTAAYYNPAGYAFIADNQLGFSQGFAQPRHELTPDYYLAGGSDAYGFGIWNDRTQFNQHEILSMPSAGFAVRLPLFGESVWGLSAYQPFDNNLTWEVWQPLIAFNDQYGDKVPTQQIRSDIDVVAFQLTVAKTFADEKLSLGLGLQLLRADLKVNDFLIRDNPVIDYRPKDIVAEFTANDGFAWGFGFKLGALYKYNEDLNFGLSLSVPFEITIDGDAVMRYAMPKASGEDTTLFEGGLADSLVRVDAEFETKLKLPTSFGFGVSYQVSEKLLVALDAEYTLWSSFKGLDYKYSNYGFGKPAPFITASDPNYGFFTRDVSNPVTWDDAGKLALGIEYGYTDFMSFLGGFSIDQSPQQDATEITPMFMQTTTRYGFSGGLIVNIEQWELGLVGSYFYFPHDRVVNSTPVDTNGDKEDDSFPGTYKASGLETIFSVNYRF